MARTRHWAVLIVLMSAGFAVLLFWLWLETLPAEPPPPFIRISQRPPPLLRAATALPLADQPNLTLAVKPYRHPSGVFGVKYPEGWQIDEAEDAVLFVAPDDSAQYSITFKRGVTATPEIRAYVQRGWGDLARFAFEESALKDSAAFHFEQQLLPDKITVVMKGQTSAQRRNGVLVWQTWLGPLDKFDRWRELFKFMENSLVFNPSK